MQKVACSICFYALLIGLMFFDVQVVSAQSIPDISNISAMSDEELSSLLRQAESMGYSDADIFQMAQSQGMSIGDISKLGQRVNQLRSARLAQTSMEPKMKGRAQSNPEWIDRAVAADERPLEERIFGYSLFNNSSKQLSFEPNLNLPTPKNYQLGAGDQVFIDIYGANEQYYDATIDKEGMILLPNIGPLRLSGLSIQQATERIKAKLISAYPGLGGSQPDTYMQVSLGNVRTVKVNIVGQVKSPGTFTLSAFATVFNALYVAGGVTTNGTLRDIKVYRNNQLISTVDVYDFLIKGQTAMNISLEDQDVIIVSPFIERVEILGEVKTPGIFEIKQGESFSDLLSYAGGFTDDAYRARVNVSRNTATDKVVADVFKEQFEIFNPKGGDVYQVGKILPRYQNRVQIKGAVYRSGNYALEEGLTVKQLIERAEGLRGDAFKGRALLIRSQEDLSTRTQAIDLEAIMSGAQEDIVLQREDVLLISSIYDTREEYVLTISGEVNEGGVYPYSQEMTVEDLIILAKGFKEGATGAKVEITRRASNPDSQDISDIITFDIDKNLNLSSADKDFVLMPFDHVTIRKNPNFRVERFVQVTGEVLYPGQYAITNIGDRISDVLARSGGLNEFAYAEGATLIRKTEFFQAATEEARKRENLLKAGERLGMLQDRTESEEAYLNRIINKVEQLDKEDSLGSVATYAKQEGLNNVSNRLSLGGIQQKESEAIAIDLEEILSNPGSKYDLILEEGDILSIPKLQQTVRMRGRVLYPTTIRFEGGRGMKHYINAAGGFDTRAQKRRTYVIYANGRVARTKGFLGLRFYPSVSPGAEVIVPTKPIMLIKPTEIVGLTTGLATLALLISQISF